MRRWTAIFTLALAMCALPARAHTLSDEVRDRCTGAGVDPSLCATAADLVAAGARTGVSAGDFTDDASASIAVRDFYFEPRVAIVRNGEQAAFTNANHVGGNPHSVSSDDIGGTSPALPVPGDAFGGGRAFRSGRLTPGTSYFLTLDANTLSPDAYVLLPDGDALVTYHCYIHGAAQMSGAFLVKGAAGG